MLKNLVSKSVIQIFIFIKDSTREQVLSNVNHQIYSGYFNNCKIIDRQILDKPL